MKKSQHPTFLTAQDQLIIGLFGVVTIMALAALSPASGLYAVVFAACFIVGLVSYSYLRNSAVIGPSGSTELAPLEEVSLREQARLADGFAEAVMIINHDRRIVYANPSARELFSITHLGSALSRHIIDPDIGALVDDTLAGGTPEPVGYHVMAPVERHIRVVGSGLASSADPHIIKRAIVIFYDITDLVRMNTMRADFLANASHELKTPVASLLGYIETLRGHAKDDPEAQETFLGIMQQQAQRMQRLIDDLLSLRRIEMVEHIEPTETADLFLAARAAMEAVKPMASAQSVKVKYDGPKEALVYGSQDELVQLVLNLLDNAVTFTPEGQKVGLDLELVDHWTPEHILSPDPKLATASKRRIVVPPGHIERVAILRVRDYGPGFPREHLHRVGERFYKISEFQESNKRGTGLGLAIVKHIVRRHRGGLYLESLSGEGSEFTILLPRSDAE